MVNTSSIKLAYNKHRIKGYWFEHFKKELDFLIKNHPKKITTPRKKLLLVIKEETSLSENFKKTIESFLVTGTDFIAVESYVYYSVKPIRKSGYFMEERKYLGSSMFEDRPVNR
jgi:hypothetical protein